jgi:nucleoside-diphosphate-sugar epimerase
MIQRQRFLILGDGRIFYHMVYVDDLVRGLKLLASRERAVGEVFILGGTEYTTLNELAKMIAEAEGVAPPRWRFPAWPVQLLGSACEIVFRPFGVDPPIYRRRVDFFTKSRAFSIDKARAVLGYEPSVGLGEGISRCLDWYRAHGYLA